MVKEKILVRFEDQGSALSFKANEEAIILFGHSDRIKEPVVARGLFVMNSEAEIKQTWMDYQQGKFWKNPGE